MWENVGEEVTVPSVIGLPFFSAQGIAARAGVTLANPDPDGPPVGALYWQSDAVVIAQRPVAGSVATRHASLVVQFDEGQPGDGQPAPTHPAGPPPRVDAGHASPDVEIVIDVTGITGGPTRSRTAPGEVT